MSFVEGRWAGEPWIDPQADREYAGIIGIHLPNAENNFRFKSFNISDISRAFADGSSIPASGPSYGPSLRATGAHLLSSWKQKVIDEGFRPLFWLGLFADRLSLRNETIVGSTRLEETRREAKSDTNVDRFLPARTFSGRDFTRADFAEADLRSVDFRSVLADGRAQARTTILRQANLSGALLDETRFDGADLTAADLRGAHANGTSFDQANLFSAELRQVRLNGASLKNANLVCADLDQAEARAAYFSRSWMTAASFEGADLGGASFVSVRMPLSDLRGATLTGTMIQNSEIQGVQFPFDEPNAASLHSNLAFGAIITSIFQIWEIKLGYNSIINNDESVTARRQPDLNVKFSDYFSNKIEEKLPIDRDYFNSWFGTQIASNFSRCGRSISIADADFVFFMERPSLLRYTSGLQIKFLTDLEKQTKANDPKGEKYRKALAGVIGDLACRGGEGVPYVARALIRNRFTEFGEHLVPVRARLKEGRAKLTACPGVAGFSEADWQALDNIKAEEETPQIRRLRL